MLSWTSSVLDASVDSLSQEQFYRDIVVLVVLSISVAVKTKIYADLYSGIMM